MIVFFMVFFHYWYLMVFEFNKFVYINLMFYKCLHSLLFFYYYDFMHFIYWVLYSDFYSNMLVMLTLWVMCLMYMYSLNYSFSEIYFINLMLLLIILMLVFLLNKYIHMYLFYEFSVFPTLFLILGWGGQYERIEAGMYMLFYTLFFSLPFMIILIYLYNFINSLDMVILFNLNLIDNMYMYIYMMLCFLVKIPVFMLHLWLPKAHVEAPITGSMILAGVMLKLGGYGLLRFMLLMEKFCLKMNYMFMSLSVIGSLLISLLCLRQLDMKILVAYSSVIHMGVMISSVMTLNFMGYLSSLMMMISHGLCSSGLFCLVNMYYERIYSRSMLIIKGMMNIIPSLSLMWFMMSIFNMSAPPSLNLFSEILMISSMMLYSSIYCFILMFLLFFGVCYMMYFYSSIQHGVVYSNLGKFIMINMWEYMILLLHLFFLFYLILLF